MSVMACLRSLPPRRRRSSRIWAAPSCSVLTRRLGRHRTSWRSAASIASAHNAGDRGSHRVAAAQHPHVPIPSFTPSTDLFLTPQLTEAPISSGRLTSRDRANTDIVDRWQRYRCHTSGGLAQWCDSASRNPTSAAFGNSPGLPPLVFCTERHIPFHQPHTLGPGDPKTLGQFYCSSSPSICTRVPFTQDNDHRASWSIADREVLRAIRSLLCRSLG